MFPPDLCAARFGWFAAAGLRCSPASRGLWRGPGPAGSSGRAGPRGTPAGGAWAFLGTGIGWLVSVENGKKKDKIYNWSMIGRIPVNLYCHITRSGRKCFLPI